MKDMLKWFKSLKNRRKAKEVDLEVKEEVVESKNIVEEISTVAKTPAERNIDTVLDELLKKYKG